MSPHNGKIFFIALSLAISLPSLASGVKFNGAVLNSSGFNPEIAKYFSHKNKFLPGEQRINIRVNASPGVSVNAIFNEHGEMCITRELLDKIKIKTVDVGNQCKTLSDLFTTAKVLYNPEKMEVNLIVEKNILLKSDDNIYRSSSALMMNYRLHAQHSSSVQHRSEYYSADLQPGFNYANWVVRQQWRLQNQGSKRVLMDSTQVSRAIEPWKSILNAGQIKASSSAYGGLPFNGIQLLSDRTLSQASPLLVPLQGMVSSDATLEIYQRNHLIYQSQIPAGAWMLDSIPGVSSYIPLEVVIKEESGANHKFTVANPIVKNNEKDQQNKWIALGKYHSQRLSSDKEHWFIAAETQLPLKNTSVGVSTLFAPQYSNLQLQKNTRVRQFNVNSLLMLSQQNLNQGGFKLGMQVDSEPFGNVSFSMGTNISTQNYIAPDEGLSDQSSNDRSQRDISGAINLATPDYGFTTLSLFSNQVNGRWQSSQALSFTTRWRKLTGTFIAQRDSSGEQKFFSLFALPLGSATITSSVNVQSQYWQSTSQYQQKIGQARVSVGAGEDRYQKRFNLAGNYLGSGAQLRAAVHHTTRQRTLSGNLSGGMAYQNSLYDFSAQHVGHTFAFITIPGQSGVPVSMSKGGKNTTNKKGYALLSTIPPWEEVTARINTRGLPVKLRFNSTSMTFRTGYGAVNQRQFYASTQRQLILSLINTENSGITSGASIVDKEGNYLTSVVGDNNILLVNEQIGKPLRIVVSGRGECAIKYDIPSYFNPSVLYESTDATCQFE